MSQALVGIIMGSDSDLPVMKDAAEVLNEAGVACELTIVSAHRTPRRLVRYAETAQERGLKVIIAGAGGAAHLPGMTAALTMLPVIGVPIKTSAFCGLDSMLSIIQMPGGVPVATVAVNGAKNAGLLALRIIALFNEPAAYWLGRYRQAMEAEVESKAENLEKKGFRNYNS
ncbi:MAG: 5-(carboxyamino)imidazole ribonucleotide mutase [Spirochaetia bacterium]|jgi:5-(carboxyamino)imidazole ribonucleotide mutase|nr:5-(carboxyamino)imidazole ribonucleotide mutase [Spirochaetia bacterium]